MVNEIYVFINIKFLMPVMQYFNSSMCTASFSTKYFRLLCFARLKFFFTGDLCYRSYFSHLFTSDLYYR